MDFSAQRTEHTAAVPFDGDFAVGVVLRGGTGDGRELEIDAIDRRAIHPDAVLRNPEDGLVARRARTRCECETGTPADAADGAGSDISEAPAFGPRDRTQDLSVSAGEPQDRSAEPIHDCHQINKSPPQSILTLWWRGSRPPWCHIGVM